MTPAIWSRHFSTDMSLSAGAIVLPEPLEVTAPVPEGLQIIVSLNNQLTSRINGAAPFDIRDPGVYFILAFGQHEGIDRFEPNTMQQYVRIGLTADDAERNGLDLGRLAASRCRRVYGQDILVLHQPLTQALKAIAMQTLVCPLQGAMRDVYLAGKCLELTAMAADAALGDVAQQDARLTGADLDRLWYARTLAIQHYQQPLTLHELARQTGTNVNKLTAGFRQMFGMSVSAFVQQHRLQEAYRMLSTGAYSVSEVAAFVGYAIPHFSTVFRKHFGFPPSRLVH